MFIALYTVLLAVLVASASADAALDDTKKSNLRRSLPEDSCSGCNFGTSGNCKHTQTGQCWRMPACSAGLIDCAAPQCECSHDDDCPLQEPFCGASDGTFGVGRGFCTCYKCIRDNYPSGADTGCPEELPKCAGKTFDISGSVGGTVCTNPDNVSAETSVMPTAGPSEEPSAAPLVEIVTKLTAGDAGDGDVFGGSVAVSGDTAIVGAPSNDDKGDASGSAYVFIRSGTTWTQQAKLTAEDAAFGDIFGASVAVSGDTVIVGAPGKYISGGNFYGIAYVFRRSETTWSLHAKLTGGGGNFGASVAVSGDTVIVGTPWIYVGDGSGAGAYVFTRSGTTWSQQAKLTAGDAAGGDWFGLSVALNGDTAVVGNPLYDGGSAYVFARSGTTWSPQAKLTAGDAAGGDYFGGSVALSGDTAFVGAPSNDDKGDASGSAYVFIRSSDRTWSQQAKLTAGDAGFGDSVGTNVAVSGDTAVVGAALDDDGGSKSGSAYVFTRSSDGTWTQQAKLTAGDAVSGDYFGYSVAVSGDTVIVGAALDDDGGTNSGSAYVYELD